MELQELDDSKLKADGGEKMVGEICIAFRVVFTGVYSVGRGLVGPEPRLSAGLGSRLRLEILQAQAPPRPSLSPGFEPKPGRNITSHRSRGVQAW